MQEEHFLSRVEEQYKKAREGEREKGGGRERERRWSFCCCAEKFSMHSSPCLTHSATAQLHPCGCEEERTRKRKKKESKKEEKKVREKEDDRLSHSTFVL